MYKMIEITSANVKLFNDIASELIQYAAENNFAIIRLFTIKGNAGQIHFGIGKFTIALLIWPNGGIKHKTCFSTDNMTYIEEKFKFALERIHVYRPATTPADITIKQFSSGGFGL